MPQSITQSQLLPYLFAIAAFLVAAVLILYIFRLVFGRRIKANGPRNRPRRLGSRAVPRHVRRPALPGHETRRRQPSRKML